MIFGGPHGGIPDPDRSNLPIPMPSSYQVQEALEKAGYSSGEELAFYDALHVNDGAVKVLGEPILKTIARELTESVRRNVSIDWTVWENARAQVRVRIKRILRRHSYPLDKQEQATKTVIEQAEVLSQAWAAAYTVDLRRDPTSPETPVGASV